MDPSKAYYKERGYWKAGMGPTKGAEDAGHERGHVDARMWRDEDQSPSKASSPKAVHGRRPCERRPRVS